MIDHPKPFCRRCTGRFVYNFPHNSFPYKEHRMPVAVTLHLLAAVIWVGGMFFAYMALRPVAGKLLEPAVRLTLWTQVFKRFFPWVWLSVLALLVTGFWMIFTVIGGIGNAGIHIHLMIALGMTMIVIFTYIYFAPYRRLSHAVESKDWPTGAAGLNRIRQLIAVNLALGLSVVTIASLGRYFF